MTYETALELTGYFASVLILISLLMSSAVKLRVLNAIGSIVFMIYGILIKSYPTAFLNFMSVIVNIYYMVKLLRGNIHFSAHRVRPEETGLQEFLQFYRNDIGHHFPAYDFQIGGENLLFLVYADANPVGLFVGTRQENGGIRVKLDYSVPKYRDCSVGKFLYSELADAGIPELLAGRSTHDHEVYLKKVGFELQGEKFVKKLK